MTPPTSQTTRTSPAPNPDTAGFWEFTARGELAMCWCGTCDRFLHPPLERCPSCGAETTFRPVSGAGTLHSFIVVHRRVLPGNTPGQLIGLVELAEQPGLRLVGTLVDLPRESVRVGMALRARIVELPGSDRRVPDFGPAVPDSDRPHHI